MSDGALVCWLAIAVGVFWGVGVHNRLLRIRAHAIEALASFDKHVHGLRPLVLAHWQALGIDNETLTARHAAQALPHAWHQLLLVIDALEPASRAARHAAPHRRAGAAPLLAVAPRLAALDAAWSQLQQEPDDLTGPAVSPDLLMHWEDTTRRLASARGGFNDITARYNEAIAQFPASLLARALRYQAAPTL